MRKCSSISMQLCTVGKLHCHEGCLVIIEKAGQEMSMTVKMCQRIIFKRKRAAYLVP